MRRKMGYALRLCHERVKEIAWLCKDGNKDGYNCVICFASKDQVNKFLSMYSVKILYIIISLGPSATANAIKSV